jgi:hypothetical protein
VRAVQHHATRYYFLSSCDLHFIPFIVVKLTLRLTFSRVSFE